MEWYGLGALAMMLGALYYKYREAVNGRKYFEQERRRAALKKNIKKQLENIDKGVERTKKRRLEYEKAKRDFFKRNPNDEPKH